MRKRQITKLDWVSPIANPQTTSVIAFDTVVVYQTLLSSAELQTSFGGMVNMKRILLSWVVEAATTLPVVTVPVYMGIAITTEQASAAIVDPEDDPDDDQWLWWHCAWLRPTGIYAAVSSAEYGREDIRSNRRIESGQDLSIRVKCPGAEVRFGAAARYLVGV